MELFWDWIYAQFAGEKAISNWASIATITAIGGSAIKYFTDRYNDKKRMSKNLYLELKDTLESLDGQKHLDDAYSVSIKDRSGKQKVAYFINRDFNHDFYDSLVFSGKINFLEPALQQPVQDIFKRIKMHNKFLTLTMEMGTPDDPVPERSHPYYEWMDNNEIKLKKEIDGMLEKLRNNFNYLEA